MNIVEKTVVAITVIIFVLVGAALVRSSIMSDNFKKCRERGGVYFKTKNDRICLKQESVIDVKIETNRF